MKLNLITKKVVVIFIFGALLFGFSLASSDSAFLKSCEPQQVFCNVSAQFSYDYELSMLPTYFNNLWQGFIKTMQNPKAFIWEFFLSLTLICSLLYFLAKLLKWNDERIMSKF